MKKIESEFFLKSMPDDPFFDTSLRNTFKTGSEVFLKLMQDDPLYDEWMRNKIFEKIEPDHEQYKWLQRNFPKNKISSICTPFIDYVDETSTENDVLFLFKLFWLEKLQTPTDLLLKFPKLIDKDNPLCRWIDFKIHGEFNPDGDFVGRTKCDDCIIPNFCERYPVQKIRECVNEKNTNYKEIKELIIRTIEIIENYYIERNKMKKR